MLRSSFFLQTQKNKWKLKRICNYSKQLFSSFLSYIVSGMISENTWPCDDQIAKILSLKLLENSNCCNLSIVISYGKNL